MVLLFAVRPATEVGACQMPIGTGGARVSLPHCVGGRGITAVVLFADENGRNEPAETAAGRRHRDGRCELCAAPPTAAATAPAATAATAPAGAATAPAAETAPPVPEPTAPTAAASHEDGALRDGLAARHRW